MRLGLKQTELEELKIYYRLYYKTDKLLDATTTLASSRRSVETIMDRRPLQTGTSPQGVLIGHCEGISHATSKGDGRYILSNRKDRSARLWDARKLSSESDSAGLPALA
eukprot:jgi/Chlat1/6128/Chrsp409S05662